MRIDVILESHQSADELARLGRLAEDWGLGGVWIANNANGRDPFLNFAWLAQQTVRLRIGPIAISPQELHPYKLAVSLLTFNEMSGGRAQVVVGGGGGVAEAMGLKPHRMVRTVRECLEILDRAARGEPVTYKGEIFDIAWLDTRWVTQSPPMIYAGANGPQMLRSAARHAHGIMVSDFTPQRIRRVHELIDPLLAERGVDPATYPLNNFWAWHVKDSAEAANREARVYLCVRGTIYPDYIGDVLDEAAAKIVTDNLAAFTRAYYRKSPRIEGVPDAIVDQIVAHGTSACAVADIDRFREFERAGLTEIALMVYGEPERAIRIIGEHIVPALSG
jgi:alkanesulfonate monooxygenase SsuD/methylene tetrahydromethanopterin reductase-like flavin-dependent oxidoreductase (luciferase family)